MIVEEIEEGGYSPFLLMLHNCAKHCWLCGAELDTVVERGETVFLQPMTETEVFDTFCSKCNKLLVRHMVRLHGVRGISDRLLPRSSKKTGVERHD